jgi:1,4-alpha-glucan branching enzyme
MYAFTENFMLPLSHDEVVHGKGPLIARMPGDEWKRFANLRLMYSLMFAHPGTKLLFMGGEFAQTSEWNHDGSLSWHLLQYDYHKGVLNLIKDLNDLYKSNEALYHYQFSNKGFEWIDYSDRDNSVILFLRKSDNHEQDLIVVANFTPEVRSSYRIGVAQRGLWQEVFNSDNLKYGGSGQLNNSQQFTSPVKYHGKDYSLLITIPPLGITVFKLSKSSTEFELE